MAKRYDYFISYTQPDRPWAEWVNHCLNENGYSTIVQFADFQAGHNFVNEMHNGLMAANRVIGILSSKYLESRFAKAEWMSALAEDPSGEDRKLIFVGVDNCETAGLLSAIVRIDVYDLPEIDAKQKLLTGISIQLVPKTTHPLFPAGQLVPQFPSSFPRFWHMPLMRTPFFLGRDEKLAEIDRFFATSTSQSYLCVTGMGGAGKTRTAIEYCHRHVNDYDLVWWIDASDERQVRHDLMLLAKEFKNDVELFPRQALIEVIRLATRDMRCLLILDSAENPANISGVISGLPNARGIVTSRNSFWGEFALIIKLEPLWRKDAIDFLVMRSGDNDREAANNLCKQLGDLPIALEQAALYIRHTACGIETYTRRFEQRRGEFKKFEDDSEQVIASVWELAFRRLRFEDLLAVGWLQIMATLGPHPIPRQFFDLEPVIWTTRTRLVMAIAVSIIRWTHRMFEDTSGLIKSSLGKSYSLASSFDSLQRYGLIEININDVSLHPLVKSVVQSRMRPWSRRTFTSLAIKLLTQVHNDNFRLDKANRLWCMHAVDLGDRAPTERSNSQDLVKMLLDASELVTSSSEEKLSEGQRILEVALSCARNLAPAERSVWEIVCLIRLINHCGELRYYAKGVSHLRTALTLVLAKNNAEQAAVIVSLMSAYGSYLLYDYDTLNAGRYFEAAIQLHQRGGGRDSLLINLLTDYSEVLRIAGEYDSAEAKALAAISLSRSLVPADDLLTARAQGQLGKIQSCMGKPESAAPHLEAAFRTIHDHFGEESPFLNDVRFELDSLKRNESRVSTAKLFLTPRSERSSRSFSSPDGNSAPRGDLVLFLYERARRIAFDNLRCIVVPELLKTGIYVDDEKEGRMFSCLSSGKIEKAKVGRLLAPLILPIYNSINSDSRWENEMGDSPFREEILNQYTSCFQKLTWELGRSGTRKLPKVGASLEQYLQFFQKHLKGYFGLLPKCFVDFERKLVDGCLQGQRRGIHGLALRVDAEYYLRRLEERAASAT